METPTSDKGQVQKSQSVNALVNLNPINGRGPHIPNGGRGHLDRRGGTWLQGHLPGDLLVLVARKTLGLSGYESPLRQSLAVPSWAFELGLANTS